MENSAAQSAISAWWVFPPKSTILLMVVATELLICVMINTPKKLKAALMRIAERTPMQRVVTPVSYTHLDVYKRQLLNEEDQTKVIDYSDSLLKAEMYEAQKNAPEQK